MYLSKGTGLLILIGSLLLPQVVAGEVPTPPSLHEECLVPCERIVDGGPGKDGIPSVDNPVFATNSNYEFDGSSLVAGLVLDGKAYAFPYEIMDWHEIVNLNNNGAFSSLTYCPLTGSAIAFSRAQIDNAELGVSGKLFENNLVMYDRDTDTYYSQMGLTGIVGENIGLTLDRIPVIETKWSTWSSLYPDTEVLTTDTGFSRRYGQYPYGNYRTSDSIFFSTSYDFDDEVDSLFGPKVVTVVFNSGSDFILFPFPEIEKSGELIEFTLGDQNYALLADIEGHFATVYQPITTDNELVNFTKINRSGELNTFEDSEGRVWSLIGQSENQELTRHTDVFNAFWFAARSFYPGASIYIDGEFKFGTDGDALINGKVYEGNAKSAPVNLVPIVIGVSALALIVRKRR